MRTVRIELNAIFGVIVRQNIDDMTFTFLPMQIIVRTSEFFRGDN